MSYDAPLTLPPHIRKLIDVAIVEAGRWRKGDAFDELVQDALLVALSKGCYEIGPGWMRQTVRFLAWKRTSHAASLDPALLVSAEPSPHARAVDKELLATMKSGLTRLPIHYREALLLVDFQGASQKASAKILCCTESALRQRLSRGRRQLRKYLWVFDPSTKRDEPGGVRIYCHNMQREHTRLVS